MSHFSVLVVTPDASKEAIAAALQPFHDYSADGVLDQYVVPVDITKNVIEAFNQKVPAVRLADGLIHHIDNPMFWVRNGKKNDFLQEETDFVLPEGAEKIDSNYLDLVLIEHNQQDNLFPDQIWTKETVIAEWLKGEPNITRHPDGTYTEMDNPNAKLDKWDIYDGEDAQITVFGGDKVGTARKDEINFESIKANAVDKRILAVRTSYTALRKITGFGELGIDVLWKEYTELSRFQNLVRDMSKDWKQDDVPFMKWACGKSEEFFKLYERFAKVDFIVMSFMSELGDLVPHDEPEPFKWAQKAPGLNSFAFVDAKGEWHAEGKMHDFGMVTDKDPKWNSKLAALIDAVPGDHYLTLVDCHM